MRQDIFSAIKTRGHMSGGRIGSASRFLRRMANAIGEARLAEHLSINPAELKAAISRTKSQLTWFDDANSSPAGTISPDPKGKDGATVKVSGTPLLKGEPDYTLTKDSILDFDCTITTARRDRDGDVLEPKGAIVDQRMALLWQHVPYQPIGRMVRLIQQDEEKVAARFMIANTPLGHDAAVLIESGCLRISHGFSPIEYQPLKDDNGKDLGGWHIQKYAMMETSVVSIPSNIDGEIEAMSRGKLKHPLIKAWAGLLNEKRTKLFPVALPKSKEAARLESVPTEVKLTIDIKGLPGATTAVEPVPAPKKKSGTPKPKKAEDDADDDDEDDDEEEGETDAKPTDTEDADADQGADADDADEGDDDADDEGEGDGDSEPAKALGELIDGIREMAKRNDLPKEAAGRLNVVNGLLEDVEANIGSSADAIGEYAKNRDIAGMCSSMGDLIDACSGQLRTVGEEIERIAGIADLPEEVASGLGEIKDATNAIVDGVSMLTSAAVDATDDADAGDADDGDSLELDDEDDDQDERDEELDERESDDDDQDDDDDDSELDEEERDADEDDRDDKEDDDEDREEKEGGDGVDTPDAEVDPTEENPGVESRSHRRGKQRRVPRKGELNDLLARHLRGENVGKAARNALRREFGGLFND